MNRWILGFLLALAAWLPQQATARHDTLYVCRAGDTIRLNTDSNYVAYSWSPSASWIIQLSTIHSQHPIEQRLTWCAQSVHRAVT
ncbi:MAG: hypothetical protein HC892_08550 [Saprospiraceae bacterium]|nr:hypothetical protein [Saprospiraceae bacterium]